MTQFKTKDAILLSSYINDVFVRDFNISHYDKHPNSVKLYRHPVFGFVVRVRIVRVNTYMFYDNYNDALKCFSDKVQMLLPL